MLSIAAFKMNASTNNTSTMLYIKSPVDGWVKSVLLDPGVVKANSNVVYAAVRCEKC